MAEPTESARDPEVSPSNPYADEAEWGTDITSSKNGGLFKRILTQGSGEENPADDSKVMVHYTGRLLDGTVFDSSVDRGEKFSFTLGQGQVIKGWDEGVATMLKGEKALLTCKPEYAYGEKGSPPNIPPNATLQFEVELFSWQGEDISGDGGVVMNLLAKGSEHDYYRPKEGAEVEIQILGKYEGTGFDTRRIKFTLGEGSEHGIISGIELAVKKMRRMARVRVEIKPQYAWGHEGNEEFGVPPNATVTYDITLLSYTKLKEAWEYDVIAERKADAESMKEKGNTFFKAKKFILALKQYERAMELVTENAVVKEEEKVVIAPVCLLLRLNVAAVQLQLKDYDKAKEMCDKVLEKDKENTKALYRRAQANFGLQNFETASEDYQELLRLEPANKTAKARLLDCANRIKMLKEKERRMYQNMFARRPWPESDDEDKNTEDSVEA